MSAFSPPVLRRLLTIFLPASFLTGAVVVALYLQERAAETKTSPRLSLIASVK